MLVVLGRQLICEANAISPEGDWCWLSTTLTAARFPGHGLIRGRHIHALDNTTTSACVATGTLRGGWWGVAGHFEVHLVARPSAVLCNVAGFATVKASPRRWAPRGCSPWLSA